MSSRRTQVSEVCSHTGLLVLKVEEAWEDLQVRHSPGGCGAFEGCARIIWHQGEMPESASPAPPFLFIYFIIMTIF